MRKDWIEIELGKVCNIISGKNQKQVSNPNGKYPIYGSGGIFGQANDYLCEAGTTVIGRKGTINTPIYVTERFWNVDTAFGITPHKEIVPKYVFYFCQGFNFHKLDKSTTIPSLAKRDLLSIRFKLAPLPEQRAIVAKIEQLFSELDNGIANLQAAKDKLGIFRQAVLKKAFEGELTKEWREQNRTESAIDFLISLSNIRQEEKQDKKGIYYKKISSDFKFSKHENVPTWAKGTLDKLIYIAARIGWRGLKKSEYTENGPLFLSVHSLNHGKYVDFSESFHLSEERYLESPEIQLQDGDVLLCKDGAGIGKIGIIKNLKEKATVNSSLLVIRGLEVLNQEFLYYLFSGPKLQSIVFERITGSATPHLFQNDIRKFELSIPPKKEQIQIVNEIESRLSVCDHVLANIEEGLEKSEALRQSILKQAFEGRLLSEAELEACRAAPDWEPAEKLLEQIKSGKENIDKKKKEFSKKSPGKKINRVDYYKRTLLAAEIVWQLQKQPTLGHLKLQKLIYLCQESGNMQLPTNFLQQAAGPYDPQMARSIDKQLKTKKWFTYRKNELLKYASLEKAGGHQADFKKYFANDINKIQNVIKLFKTGNSEQMEIVATLYACCKRIIRENADFSERLLIKRFYEWSEEKSKYSESRVKKAVKWMEEKGIVPVNFKKQTVDE